MTTDKLLLLSPGEKKVAAKVLSEEGYSTRKIESLLGIDNMTAWRASKKATPEELLQFETEFKEALAITKEKGLSLTQKRMLEIIPKYERLDHLVKAAEYFEGKNNTNIAVQVNNITPERLKDDELNSIIS